MNDDRIDRLGQAVAWARRELEEDILPWWERYARDLPSGGFFAHIDNAGCGQRELPRSVVMVSRFLWTYAAAARQLHAPAYLDFATYAYRYLVGHFVDREYGGVFWAVNPDGSPAISKKQVYGEAFAIYGLSEYALALLECSKEAGRPAALEARDRAISIYELLETRVLDRETGGYGEAVSRDWSPTTDLKLSSKDMDCDKSMNTNLHVMEAYSNLLRLEMFCAKEGFEGAAERKLRLAGGLSRLVDVSLERILGPDNHLDLYFDRSWTVLGEDIISYGHDIEASWLLEEAAALSSSVLSARGLSRDRHERILAIARTALDEGFDPESGGFDNEMHGGKRDSTRVWWCQAEALVGFVNAWELSGEEAFLDAALAIRSWIEEFQIDREKGEWFPLVSREGLPLPGEAKGGNWKTCYHNGRACLELIRRFDSLRSGR